MYSQLQIKFHKIMQTITLNIDNPQIESFLFNISKTENKTIESLVYDALLQYFINTKKETNLKTEIVEAINSNERYIFKYNEFIEVSENMVNDTKVDFEQYKKTKNE